MTKGISKRFLVLTSVLILIVAAVFLTWRGIFGVDCVRDDHSAKALVAHDGERRENSKRRGSTLDDRSVVVIDAIKKRKIKGEDIPESLLASARKLIHEKSVSRPHRFMLADLALDEYWATKEIEAIFRAEICGQSFATVRDLFVLVPNYARGKVSDAISQNSEISMEDVPDVLDWLSNLGPEERRNAITNINSRLMENNNETVLRSLVRQSKGTRVHESFVWALGKIQSRKLREPPDTPRSE